MLSIKQTIFSDLAFVPVHADDLPPDASAQAGTDVFNHPIHYLAAKAFEVLEA
jgi:hypothetical protein